MMESNGEPDSHVWDTADWKDVNTSTGHLQQNKVRAKSPKSGVLQIRTSRERTLTAENKTSNREHVQGRQWERDWNWDRGMHEDAARSRQREGKPLELLIGMIPSSGFSNAPLAYLARQMPPSDHEDLYSYHDQLIDASTKCYGAAVHRWVDLLWNVARSHELLFHGIVYFARYHHKSTSAAHNSFLNSKTRILRLIAARMQRASKSICHDGRTLVAIALLAYSDMIDGDFQAAETHVRALPLLSAPDSWFSYEWVYVAWIDLRLALLKSQRPTLSYYIPAAFRDPPAGMAQQGAPARKLALSNSKHGPRGDVEPAFTNVCFHMFSSLHEVGLAWNTLHQSASIPFGTLYELEYSLRAMQVDIRASEFTNRSSRIKELILLCIQLQTWILARFWIPQRQETYLIVLHRAQNLLEELISTSSSKTASSHHKHAGQDLPDLLDPTCLLWIAFTLAGTAIEYGHPCQTLCLRILGRTAKTLHVKNHGDLTRQLRKWPWLDNWHESKFTLLWPRIRPLLGLPYQRWQNVIDGNAPVDEVRVEQPPASMSFFGGLEFYVDG